MTHIGKTILVTGGAGAIGSRLVRRLLAAGAARVYVVDDLSSGHAWLLPKDERVTFLRRDVASPKFMQGVPFGLDAFFHLAAHFANLNSCENPIADLRGNALGTLRALEAAALNRCKRFVFASCGCGVGRQDTPYQAHKKLGEFYCEFFAERVPTVVCRFHNSYGEGEVPGLYRNVIPNFIWAAMHGEPLTVVGDGDDTRDFVYVGDLVEFLVHEAEPSTMGRAATYEIGTGVRTSISDLAEMVVAVTGSKSEIAHGATRRRWDHAGRASEKPIAATVTLREGIERTYAWMKKHEREIRESMR